MALIKHVRSLSRRLVPPFFFKRTNQEDQQAQETQNNQEIQEVQTAQIRQTFSPANPRGYRARRRMTNPPGDVEQPLKGDILTLHSNPAPAPVGMPNESMQDTLKRKRHQFIATLPRNHALRERVSRDTGELVSDRHQPSGRVRSIASSSEEARLRRRAKKSREDVDSPDMALERNRFRAMWNGISERVTREEEWMEFDRVKTKLLSIKRKHCFFDTDLQDERELDRKRAKSRRRSQRDRCRDTGGSDEDKGRARSDPGSGIRSSSQERSRGTSCRRGRPRHTTRRHLKIPPVVIEDTTGGEEK